MACPGGCIGGGGQPYPPEGYQVLDPELLRKRAGALYTIDSGKKLRKSYENPAVEEIYDAFLGGPGSELAHELLHTHYTRETTARHSMSLPCTATTDNWEHVRRTAREVLGEPMALFIDECRAADAAGEPADRRAAPGADAIRLPEPDASGRRRATAGGAGGQGGRRGQLLSLLPPAAAGQVHHQRLPGHGLLRQGADRIARRVMDELGITWGETSKDGIFTLERPAAWAPAAWPRVVMIDDEVHGQVTPDQVPGILEKYLKKPG